MTRLLKGHQVVFLVVPPTDWKPTSLWSFPPAFSAGELHCRNLRPGDANGFARAHNKSAMELIQAGQPSEWAIIGRYLRPSWRGSKGGGS
jgi:hypothetical protein